MNSLTLRTAAATIASVAFLATPAVALAATSGPNSGTTFSGSIAAPSGDHNWSNSSNATSSNNSRATVTIGFNNVSNYLRATGFGFSIPVGSTIDGVTVSIERSEGNQNSSAIVDNIVSLVKDNVVVGDDKGTATAWPTSDATATYGGISDLWGTTWTVTDINDADFGVVLSVGRTIIGDEQARVDHITITVTYTPAPSVGSLEVTKLTAGGDGTFDFTGDAGSFSITTTGGTGSETISDLEPGSYSVNESPEDGWIETSNDCDDISVVVGETATCTIENTKLASITVIKDVVNPDEGEAEDNTSFTVNLGEDNQEISEGDSHTYENLVPGTYTITEDENSNYEFVSFSEEDEDSETPGMQITVGAGEYVELTITNKQKVATLTIIKNVVHNGVSEEASPEDFTMSVEGSNVLPGPSFPGSDEGTTITLFPGEFSIEESGPEGYIASYSEGCGTPDYDGSNGEIGSNEEITCTITNSDIPEGMGAIIVVKDPTNDNGGAAIASDFTLTVTPFEGLADTVLSGDANFLSPGTYIVGEGELPEGYTYVSTSCTNGETTENGEITLNEQELWVCTIVNDDLPAILTIKKWTNPEGADGTFNFTISGPDTDLEPSVTTVGGVGETSVELDAGTYDVQEIVPPGWEFSYVSCDYDGEEAGQEIELGETIIVGNGDEVTCHFYNLATGADLSVTKAVSDASPATGETVIYTVTVTNNGPLSLNNVVVTDILPIGVTFVSSSVGEAYEVSTGEWTVGALSNGESSVMEITVTVNDGTEGQTIINTSAVNSTDEIGDQNGDNDSASVSLTVTTPEQESSGGGGGNSSGSGCTTGFVYDFATNSCVPSSGQVLGASTGPTSVGCEVGYLFNIMTGQACPQGQVLGASSFQFLVDFGFGSIITPDVTELQKILIARGLLNIVAPTGWFGPLTKAAVQAYQGANGIITTGFVGPLTRGALNSGK